MRAMTDVQIGNGQAYGTLPQLSVLSFERWGFHEELKFWNFGPKATEFAAV